MSPLPFGISAPRFRLPDETRIGRVRLQVADLQRSIDYYERVIGLFVRERSGGSAVMTAKDDGRPLLELHEKRGVQRAPGRGAFGLYHFAILLPGRADLGRFVAHLATLGIRFGAADHLVSEAIYLTDPDGLGIEIYADRPRDEWQVRGRELLMATDPLDLGNLVDAAGDAEWAGAPAGTTIGHVHLHVGNLEAGEAFYHAALGFDKVVWGYPGALFLSAGGYHHHLGTNTWSAGPAATDEQARLLEWELLVPSTADARAAAESLGSAGFATEADRESWTVRDPWGTRLRIAPAA
jgi:catechol 2,3-dioxygenase